jgi:hypothetical protein
METFLVAGLPMELSTRMLNAEDARRQGGLVLHKAVLACDQQCKVLPNPLPAGSGGGWHMKVCCNWLASLCLHHASTEPSAMPYTVNTISVLRQLSLWSSVTLGVEA